MSGLELGIDGRKALVCGSSRGLGKACALSLAIAGVEVTLNGRNRETLEATSEEISQIVDRPVSFVVADITTEEGRRQALDVCGTPDILINNAAGPPPGQFEDWDEEVWLRAMSSNMVSPILLIKSVIGTMRERGWGRIVNITSAAVKSPLPLLGLSNGARSGLTGFIAGLSREVARDGVTINNILPGNFLTDRLTSYVQSLASQRGVTSNTVWQELEDRNPTGRIGNPNELGSLCAYLCSAHAGFMTGQNFLLDGGTYPGVF
jgi:3-oxoacyl-[acyl-carrier protein] reductase